MQAKTRKHRVFIPELIHGTVDVQGDEARHLLKVLRVVPGTPLLAFDGKGYEAEGQVEGVEGMSLRLSLAEAKPSEVEPVLKITMAVSLLKGDKLAQVVRQGTELGVNAFRLFTSRYSDVPSLSANKLTRLQRIAQEASKQSGRSLIPEVFAPVALNSLVLQELSLLADPRADRALEALKITHAQALMIVTGPEGGFSPEEVQVLEHKGARAVRLGARILRAETAPVALTAALLLPSAL